MDSNINIDLTKERDKLIDNVLIFTIVVIWIIIAIIVYFLMLKI